MRMQLVMAQMVHQWRLVPDLPVAVLPFDETVMLCGAPQRGNASLFDFAPGLRGADVGNGAGEIDARAPGLERGQKRQLSKVPAIVFCGGAGEQTGLAIRGTGDPASDGEARGETLHIPLKGSRKRFVEIIDIEDRRSLGCRIGTEIRQMAVAAGLHPQSSGRAASEV